jgi:hypothetical protein
LEPIAMNSILFRTGAILAPAFIALLCSHSVAQSRAEAQPVDAPAAIMNQDPWSGVLYDEPGDGRLWAVGASWKASFGADGVVYFPRTGASEARRLPHALSPDLVTIGGESLPFERTVQSVRIGDRVELHRGTFTERYDLASESVEQSFVFESLPRAGDLVLRIPIASDLVAVETDAGLEFRSDNGRIQYSRAIAVDARGHRTSAATRIEDGAITIRVAAEVLEGAEFPLVIDPVLGPIWPDLTQDDTFSLDAAYDAFNQIWVVVYERIFSASDHDVVAKMYGSTGTLIATASVDATTDSWVAPRIADLGFFHKFLVVGGATAASNGVKTIRGRIMQPAGTLLIGDLQVPISGVLPGECVEPDVGGDSTDTPGTWCVVFQHDVAGSSHTVERCLVSSSGSVAFGPTAVPQVAGTNDGTPSISKSSDGSAWFLTWEHQVSLSASIEGARISPTGALITSPFTIAGGTLLFEPRASSALFGTNRYAVVYQSGVNVGSLDSTIVVALIDGGTVLQIANLMTLENSTTASEGQTQPSVDSDGQHFLVSYSESTVFGHDELFATDLAVVGNTLQIAQSHLGLQPGLGLSQWRSNVAAARAMGPLANRYLVVYDYRQNDVNHDAAGRFVDGLVGDPPAGTSFCSGDGSLPTPCPCVSPNTVPSPSGAPGHGCANTFDLDGAILSATGTLSPDGIQFTCEIGGNYASFALMLKGDASNASGVANGDGILCITGALRRFGAHNAATGGAPLGTWTLPNTIQTSSISAASGQVPGQTAHYQLFYRNAQQNFCTSSTFNWSNGYSLVWPP